MHWKKSNPNKQLLTYDLFINKITKRNLTYDSVLTILELHPKHPEYNNTTIIEKHTSHNDSTNLIITYNKKGYSIEKDTNKYFVKKKWLHNDTQLRTVDFFTQNCNIYDKVYYCSPPTKRVIFKNGVISKFYVFRITNDISYWKKPFEILIKKTKLKVKKGKYGVW